MEKKRKEMGGKTCLHIVVTQYDSGIHRQGVSQKINNWWRFLQIGEIRLLFTKGCHHGWWIEKKMMQPIERWETPSWERNISEHDIIQHTQITTEKCFFLWLP